MKVSLSIQAETSLISSSTEMHKIKSPNAHPKQRPCLTFAIPDVLGCTWLLKPFSLRKRQAGNLTLLLIKGRMSGTCHPRL